MRVGVLGSGSSGNAIAVSAGDSAVLIDAGLAGRVLEQRARAAGFPLETLRAIILTHEHGDHARGAPPVARRVGCPVYGSVGTLAALRGALEGIPTVAVEQLRPTPIGSLTLTACRTAHDAVEPVALALSGPEPGERVGVAYDIGRATAAVRYLLRGSACLVVEANHDEILLRTGPYPPGVRRRIAGAGGHLSNRAAADLLGELCHAGLRVVVLAHVSQSCNRPDLAEDVVREALAARGFAGTLLVAPRETPLATFEVGSGVPAGASAELGGGADGPEQSEG